MFDHGYRQFALLLSVCSQWVFRKLGGVLSAEIDARDLAKHTTTMWKPKGGQGLDLRENLRHRHPSIYILFFCVCFFYQRVCGIRLQLPGHVTRYYGGRFWRSCNQQRSVREFGIIIASAEFLEIILAILLNILSFSESSSIAII